ncbi:class I tRNA ligase family protein, partial [Candidatus Pacebacteria bacterium]|nr:class I tRNA ligase family protein [Candidatus Paceibacterota bacterium]
PIPVINCSKCGPVEVPKEDLPVELPEVENYLPRDDGKSPLAKATEWMSVDCPKCGGSAERETDTLDTFVDSSWYYLRYTDPKNTEEFADQEKLKKWMPVDFYSGGAEHTTMHVLYSRFFNKFLFDQGLVKEKEPYVYRLNRGLVLGTDGNKMSKSKGNVIDPDGEVERLGADTVRNYLAFIGPYNEVGNYPWDPNGVVGIRRFIERVSYVSDKIKSSTDEGINKILHQSIKKVGEDAQRLKFNTAISQLMVLTSEIQKKGISKEDAKKVAIITAPFAPHVAEELWNSLGGEGSVHQQNWPEYDESVLKSDKLNLVIQIDGKVRDNIEVDLDTSEEEIKAISLENEVVKKWLEGKKPKKIIYVKNKLISIVT